METSSAAKNHAKNDRIKLLKFAKDAWDMMAKHFCKSKEGFEKFKKLKHILFHVYGNLVNSILISLFLTTNF